MSSLIFFAEPPIILELQLKLRERRVQSKMSSLIFFAEPPTILELQLKLRERQVQSKMSSRVFCVEPLRLFLSFPKRKNVFFAW